MSELGTNRRQPKISQIWRRTTTACALAKWKINWPIGDRDAAAAMSLSSKRTRTLLVYTIVARVHHWSEEMLGL